MTPVNVLIVSIALSMNLQTPPGQPNVQKRAKAPTSEPAVDASDNPYADFVTNVVSTKHIAAHEIGGTIKAIFPGVRATFVGDNQVVLRASASDMKAVLETMSRLDRPQEEPAERRTSVHFVPLRNRMARDVAPLVAQAIRGVNVAADVARSSIVLSGDRNQVDQAMDMVRGLDTALSSVPLEFAILHARTDKSAVEGEDQLAEYCSAMPADLNDVAKELERYGELRLLCRLSTIATEGDKFSVAGAVASRINVNIDGIIDSAPEGGVVRLNVKAAMERAPTGANAKSEKGDQMMLINTGLSAERGDTVVLGTVPTGWRAGESAILVVRVSAAHGNKKQSPPSP